MPLRTRQNYAASAKRTAPVSDSKRSHLFFRIPCARGHSDQESLRELRGFGRGYSSLLAKLVRHYAAFLIRCSIGFTDSRSPAAPRMAVRLRSSGFPDFESIR